MSYNSKNTIYFSKLYRYFKCKKGKNLLKNIFIPILIIFFILKSFNLTASEKLKILIVSLYDMAGNVGEWCVLNSKNNSYGVCGGSWALNGKYQKSEYFNRIDKSIKNPTIGFRLIYIPKE